MRKAARKSNILHNMHRVQFQVNVEIPLVKHIDKRLTITPDMRIENPDTIGENPTYEVLKRLASIS